MADRGRGMRTVIERVRAGQIAEAGRLVGAGGLVTITADTAEEAIAFAKIVLRGAPATSRTAAVDVTRCGSTVAFCREFARAVVGLYLGGNDWLDYPQEQWPGDVQEGLLKLGDLTGGGLIHAVTAPRPLDVESAVELFAAAVDGLTRFALSGTPTLIALLGADELVPSGLGRGPLDGADELLWTFRGRLQHAIEEPGVLLAGSDIAGELTADESAAFFGWGTTIALRAPARLEEAVAQTFVEDGVKQTVAIRWATEVVERSEGSLVVAERLTTLTVAERGAGAPAATAVAVAWRRLRELTDSAYRQIARELRSLHRLALPVALAIADSRPPYSVDRFSSGPNKALTRLHAAGFIVQHAPRHWRLTDPLLASWLRENPVSGRPELGLPTLWVLRRAANSYLVADGASLGHVRSAHRSSEAAQQAASAIARDTRGANVMVIDSDDPDDFPFWALPILSDTYTL